MPELQFLLRADVAIVGWAVGEPFGFGRPIRLVVLEVDHPFRGQRVNFSHHYFDPPRFTGIRELVFASAGAVDLPGGSWQPREKRDPVKLEVPNAGQDSTYMAMAAFVEDIHNNNRKPLNGADSALRSTLQVVMATKAIYERRIVTWEEVAG
jgi:hypothetical protein